MATHRFRVCAVDVPHPPRGGEQPQGKLEVSVSVVALSLATGVSEAKRELLKGHRRTLARSGSEMTSLRAMVAEAAEDAGEASPAAADKHEKRSRNYSLALLKVPSHKLVALDDALDLQDYVRSDRPDGDNDVNGVNDDDDNNDHAQWSRGGRRRPDTLVMWRRPKLPPGIGSEGAQRLATETTEAVVRAVRTALSEGGESESDSDSEPSSLRSDGDDAEQDPDAVRAFEAKAARAFAALSAPVVEPPPGSVGPGEEILWRSEREGRNEMVLFERQASGTLSAMTCSCVLFCTQFSLILVAVDRSSYNDQGSRMVRLPLAAVRAVDACENFDGALQVDIWSADFRLVRLLTTQHILHDKIEAAVARAHSSCFAQEFCDAQRAESGIKRRQHTMNEPVSSDYPSVLDRDPGRQSRRECDQCDDSSSDSESDNPSGEWELLDRRLDYGVGWRASTANDTFALCPSYPQELWVPADRADDILLDDAQLFAGGRFPVCVYKHAVSGASLVRCGAFGSHHEKKRAGPRRARGDMTSLQRQASLDVVRRACVVQEGVTYMWENQEQPLEPQRTAMHVSLGVDPRLFRERWDRFHELCRKLHGFANDGLFGTSSDIDDEWLTDLHRSQHFNVLQTLFGAATTIAECLRNGTPVVVVEEVLSPADGEKVSSLVSVILVISLVMVDPYYRTFEGFQVLFDSTFVAFLDDKCDVAWQTTLLCDLLWNLMSQFPREFEITTATLEWLATQSMTRLAGHFAFVNAKERFDNRASSTTLSLWRILALDAVASSSSEAYAPASLRTSSAALLPNIRYAQRLPCKEMILITALTPF
jgi:Myotubularin-like phosphatase domain